ncbi:MAG: hypothetical protein V4537_07955 [Pseudomonadota bacterium]
MSDVAVRGGTGDAATFRPLTVVLLIVIGVLAFSATLVFGAYAPDMKPARGGGTHALSNAATGFSGLFRLADGTERFPYIVRDIDDLQTENLVVLSPPTGSVDVGEPLARRNGEPTLIILPKWRTAADPDHKGWVRTKGLLPVGEPQGVLAPGNRLIVTRGGAGGGALTSNAELYDSRLNRPIRFTAPARLQTIAGEGLRPMIVDAAGRVVLGELGDRKLYVLADPDLMSNAGMRDPAQARAALALLDFLGPREPDGVVFDVTLSGLGRHPSPLKLAFEPPFLAMTLTIVAVLLLVGLHAFGRFGPPALRTRAIAFGKAALVDNTAALVRKAGREAALGGRYAQMIRERAIPAFGVPAHLEPDAIDAYLDRLGRRSRFSDLARDADAADDPRTLVAAAQALHDWQQGKTT